MNSNVFKTTADSSPGLLFWQVTMLWQRRVKAVLDPYNIPHAQFVILAILLWLEHVQIKATQVQIADFSLLDKMTVSKSLKLLASKGLVLRKGDVADTRAKQSVLTHDGREMAKKLIPLVEAVDAQFFSDTLGADQIIMVSLLRKLVSACKDR